MPRTILHEVAATLPALDETIPWRRWTGLLVVAIGGSCLYGASLSLVLPGWELGAAALWLALSAGLAWCLFIPALCFGTGLGWRSGLDASFVTMAFGEVVLTSGALVNGLLWWRGVAEHAVLINSLVVALSNVVMAALLALQLRERGVPLVRTLGLWMLVLNGSGAVFFFTLYRTLHGG